MLAEEAIYETFTMTLERRRSLRIRLPAAVKFRWHSRGRRSEVATIIDNISAGGFSVRLMQGVIPGARVFALIEFPSTWGGEPAGSRLAVRGKVLRVECLPEGVFGVAVMIDSHRFI